MGMETHTYHRHKVTGERVTAKTTQQGTINQGWGGKNIWVDGRGCPVGPTMVETVEQEMVRAGRYWRIVSETVVRS